MPSQKQKRAADLQKRVERKGGPRRVGPVASYVFSFVFGIDGAPPTREGLGAPIEVLVANLCPAGSGKVYPLTVFFRGLVVYMGLLQGPRLGFERWCAERAVGSEIAGV